MGEREESAGWEMTGQLLLPLHPGPWQPVSGCDAWALLQYERHYSCYRYRDGRLRRRFVGPGEYIALVTPDRSALFVWRKFRSMDAQDGVNCAVFRNEGSELSSRLILAAESWAWQRWPHARLYTYINPKVVRSPNPGYCFKCAGWRQCGLTKKRKLVVLEKNP
jgi:hypothetical protein